jgi:hypothetical protein
MPSPTLIACRAALVAANLVSTLALAAAAIPLPEHPRPDFERADWVNLNGPWQFRFDKENAGQGAGWAAGQTEFPETITVPFPWGAKLSGVDNKADIGWYRRAVKVPEAWQGKRVFLVVGACDWQTQGWLDGQALGEHRGGYTPFEFELTPNVKWGQDQQLVLRVDDTPHPFKLEGKQGYGAAKGIWQTPYLEARPALHLTRLHYAPDLDTGRVTVKAQFNAAAPAGAKLALRFKTGGVPEVTQPIASGAKEVQFAVPIANAHLWSLDDPFLYEVDAALSSGAATDQVGTYFGMRQIGIVKLPGTEFPYVALNHKPVYLQITLDQSYHPDGFYTFPSDAFMRDEILRSKRIGLNAHRIHIKVEVPRKLYWADRLGLLIMADVPNFWGDPTAEAQQESEFALRGMVARDFNHPAIFSWVTFNETWGLFTKQGAQKAYLPQTQAWVIQMYRLAKQLDPTRLVEDNSPCNGDHTETDLNTWHDYLPGYAWRARLDQIVKDTHAGSPWNFIGGRQQGHQPLFNSECGNVWGYDGSTGDVDWSWDYHIMMKRIPPTPQDRRLALHRAPRRHQRMERLLPLRSFREVHRAGRPGPGHEPDRLAQPFLYLHRRPALPRRPTGPSRPGAAVRVVPDRARPGQEPCPACGTLRLEHPGPARDVPANQPATPVRAVAGQGTGALESDHALPARVGHPSPAPRKRSRRGAPAQLHHVSRRHRSGATRGKPEGRRQ